MKIAARPLDFVYGKSDLGCELQCLVVVLRKERRMRILRVEVTVLTVSSF